MKKTENRKAKKESSSAKTPLWFYAVPFLIPVLFFILLEAGLRLFNYGTDYSQFVTFENYPGKYFLNPDLPLKYFSGISTAPGVINDAFDIEKRENTFRIFVLGGSSAAGWPYVPNAAFSRQLKRRLELLYPDTRFEVINCGVSAINTYTIRDFVPEIAEQKPDLVLIYAGHNEYYGALGVGSTFSMGQSRFIKNTYIALMDYKTTQLLRDFINSIYGLFSSAEKINSAGNETLMGKMIGESAIPYNSENFNLGIEQFESNYRDILQYFKDAGIAVITGTLTMNLKDLRPFVSLETNGESADGLYKAAQREYQSGNYDKARELFVRAKDLDALRFRAPEKINEAILRLSEQFNFPSARVDLDFNMASSGSVTGSNLMVDHLHPNEEGYALMAKSFYNIMEKDGFLPGGRKLNISPSLQDSLLMADFPVTKIDSVIADMRIAALTGSYPFVPKGTANEKILNFKFDDWIDSTALKVVNLQLLWATAHLQAAERFYSNGDYRNFAREMNAIVEDRPANSDAAEYAATKLIDAGQTLLGEYFLKKLHREAPSFFTYKWLGQIALNRKDYNRALNYLSEAVKMNSSDSQLLYNLAGAYYYKGSIELALKTVEKSLSINPRNQQALNFYEQLKKLTKKE